MDGVLELSAAKFELNRALALVIDNIITFIIQMDTEHSFLRRKGIELLIFFTVDHHASPKLLLRRAWESCMNEYTLVH